MKNEVVILIAEDDEGHAELIIRNLERAGIQNRIIKFRDGQETLDFLFGRGDGPYREKGAGYLLLLDIRMPRADGIEVLKRIKLDSDLRKMPVIMVTTTDDPKEVEECHDLGCSNYVTKPVDYEKFVDVIRKMGLFLLIVEVPRINS